MFLLSCGLGTTCKLFKQLYDRAEESTRELMPAQPERVAGSPPLAGGCGQEGTSGRSDAAAGVAADDDCVSVANSSAGLLAGASGWR